MSFLKETEMGEDGNKKELKDRQNQPQDREGAISRRRFLGLVTLAGAGVALGGLSLRGITSAEVRRAVDLDVTFANLRREQKDLLLKPDSVFDFFLNKNSSGEVTDIYVVANNDRETPMLGRYIYRSSLEGDKFSVFKPFPEFPFAPSSVIRKGNLVLACGDKKSMNLALQYSTDGVSFKDVPNLPKDRGFVVGLREISGTNKLLLSLGRFESGISLATFDTDTMEVRDVLREEGWAAYNGMAAAGVNGVARVITSGAVNRQFLEGYLDAKFDLSTNRTISADLKCTDKGYTRNVFTSFDSGGGVENVFVTNMNQEVYMVNGKTGEVTSWSYRNALENVGNYTGIMPLDLDPLLVRGNTVWAAGAVSVKSAEGSRPILIAKSVSGFASDLFKDILLVETNTNKNISIGRDNLQFGIFNGKHCLFFYVFGFGLGVLEINPDGTPIAGAKPIFIGTGLGELPKKYIINLPYVAKQDSGK